MIQLKDKASGRLLGSISEAQLQFLVDQLEEEWLEDKDYAITTLLLEMFEAEGADPELVALLRSALGDQDEIEISWSR